MLIGRAADGSNLNVSAAVDTLKAVQRQQETAAQQDSPAYQVELSGAAESYKSHWRQAGHNAYLTTRAGQSQEDELAEMMAAIEDVTKQREQNKKPWSWTPNADLQNVQGLETVQLQPMDMKDAPDLVKQVSAMTRNTLPKINLVVPADKAFRYPDSIDTIKSQHYTWTAKDGLVENTATAEGAAKVAETEDKLKNTLKQEISDTISDILKPYTSYSEAYDELKDKNVFVNTYEHAGDSVLTANKEISGGLFGKLASQLNDYAKNFGTDDKFFEDIKTAFGVINGDSPDKNPLLGQVEKMVRYVQGGGELDVKDRKYEEDVNNAIAKAYKDKSGAQNVVMDKKNTAETAFKTDTSYLDNLRQQFEQTAEMLDKMTAKSEDEGKHQTKTARDVLDSRAPEDSFDMDFHQRLAHVDDRSAPVTDTSHGIFDHTKPTDALTENDTNELAALQAGWNDYVQSHNLIDASKVTSVFLS
jgi:uncharacterized membrane-anchored protein YhcB (DUF1043 family)